MGGSGIRSEVGVAVGLCSRWEAGNLLQRACGAVGLVNCTVGECGFYTDPVSSATLFDFCTGTPLRQQELPRIPLPPAPLQSEPVADSGVSAERRGVVYARQVLSAFVIQLNPMVMFRSLG